MLDLYKVISKIPIENSKPAKPKHKKVNDIMTISSFIIPNTQLSVYIITHTVSEKIIIFIKLLLLKTTESIDNHSKDKKNEDHDSK